MTLFFSIEYFTEFGENLQLVLYNNDIFETIPMQYLENGIWKTSIVDNQKHTNYYYQIFDNRNGNIRKEWKERTLPKINHFKEVFIYDFWNKANFPENYLGSKMFAYDKKLKSKAIPKSFTHKLTIKAPLRNPNHTICILGNNEKLGNWKSDKCTLLNQNTDNVYELLLDLSKANHVIQYKYGIFDVEKQQLIHLENGNNRTLFPNQDKQQLIIQNDVYFKYDFTDLPRIAGIAVPVFSLRTKNSAGIGEFLDLKELADFCHNTGISLIQILPINDTIATHSWTDSYPYAAISVYALNPIYISIKNLPYKLSKEQNNSIQKESSKLNALQSIDWENVIKLKFSVLREIFDKNISQILKDNNYKNFLELNKHWIKDYAVFCVLRDFYQTPDFSQWKKYQKYDLENIEKFFNVKSKEYNEVHFHAFIQYHLHLQLTESVNYLHTKGIKIKGDLPIGIYRHSVEAWKEPQLFGMDFQAGAPPDDFAVLGQNWEFPTYNWEAMKATEYSWWKNRFKALEQYFDAIRIDHILGFFRIWRIPQNAVQGILGYFYPANPITEAEFAQRNIYFDQQRFCTPFITKEILQNYFEDETEAIINEYFNRLDDKLHFKPQVDCQRKIVEWFAKNPTSEVKKKLLELAANVLFITEIRNNEQVYHPRFNAQKTISYQYLDWNTQQKISELYIDYFFKRQENLWYNSAMEKLPNIMQSTKMLICGEDLGLVPKCVPKVMNELGILSLQVQRMPNDDILYHNPANAPYLSVVTPATHDTSTVRQWWKEDEALSKHYYYHQLGFKDSFQSETNDEIMKTIIEQHYNSPAMISVIPIQELFALTETTINPDINSERINIPAIFPHNWKYRMHISINEMIKTDKLKNRVKELTINAKR